MTRNKRRPQRRKKFNKKKLYEKQGSSSNIDNGIRQQIIQEREDEEWELEKDYYLNPNKGE